MKREAKEEAEDKVEVKIVRKGVFVCEGTRELTFTQLGEDQELSLSGV